MVNPTHKKLERFGDKHRDFYKFSTYLIDVGDYVVTQPLDVNMRERFRKDVGWWASRNNKVVTAETVYVLPEGDLPGGLAIKATLLRNYRYKK